MKKETMCKRIFLLAIFFVVITPLFSETWIYEKEVVIIQVGEEENEISVIDHEFEQDEGPTSFTIDEDENIYIRTRRKNIIKKFDKNGKYVCSSKLEKGLGDAIRFLGYNNNIIYTMSGDARNPVIRRYDKFLNLIDCHKIKKDYERQWIGLHFISNYKGDFGFLSWGMPGAFKQIVLKYDFWRLRSEKFMDFSYKKIDFKKYWAIDIGYRFINYDNKERMYFEMYNKPKTKTELGIVFSDGKIIKTNIKFDHPVCHNLHFDEMPYPLVRREGKIYNIVPLKDRVEFIKWHKIQEEK
jgi:hypothetical protein